MYEYAGNVHIHSHYSDGSGSIEEITWAAQKAGLDFIIITDHFNLDGLRNREQGYRNQVLTIIGMEVNEECNHYLALETGQVVPNQAEHPQKVIDQVNHLGGFGIIAHPFEVGSPLYYNWRTYEWNDWTVTGFQGIEIWNFLSQLRDGFTSFLRGLYLLFNPHAAMKGPYRQAMQKLDSYQQQGIKIAAFGGSDAHQTRIGWGRFKPFVISPYQLCFRCINMHVLLPRKLSGEFEPDKIAVCRALQEGNSWIAYDYFKSSQGFQYYLLVGDRQYYSGSTVKYQPNMVIKALTPWPATVQLFRNGRIWEESTGSKHIFTGISEGVYRAQIYQKRRGRLWPWIFTNSIWVV